MKNPLNIVFSSIITDQLTQSPPTRNLTPSAFTFFKCQSRCAFWSVNVVLKMSAATSLARVTSRPGFTTPVLQVDNMLLTKQKSCVSAFVLDHADAKRLPLPGFGLLSTAR
jgi:hypothetical protein